MWAKVWAILTGVFGWMWNHKEAAGFIILAIIIAFLTWQNNQLNLKNSQMKAERDKLPDNISFITTLKDTSFRVEYRDSKNNTVVKDFYVPREGSITFTKYIDLTKYDAKSGFQAQALNPPTITNPIQQAISNIPFIGHFFGPPSPSNKPCIDCIVIQPYGVTLHPGISGTYVGGANPFQVGLDFKLLYFYRWSSGLGSTTEFPYVFVSRHVDDLVPFFKVDNLEIMVDYGKPYSNFGNSVVGVGARTNF